MGGGGRGRLLWKSNGKEWWEGRRVMGGEESDGREGE